MTFHFASATADYRDFMTKLAALATSKSITAALVNNGGSGYVTGDIVKISHAGAFLEATMEVTAAAGVITSLKVRNMGAYSNRVSSASVVAGGSGYTTNDILEIQGGTAFEKAKVKVATLSGSAVATVTVFETGGSYSVAPGAASTTVGVGRSDFAGNNAATVTPTMTGLVATTNVTLTTVTGVGTGGTANITLTDGGWTSVRNRNNFSFNSILDEKEVILQGTVTGGDVPFIGWRTYKETAPATSYGAVLVAFDDFNNSLTFDAQPNAMPSVTPHSSTSGQDGAHMLLQGSGMATPITMDAWFSVSPRRLVAVAKCAPTGKLSYTSMYLGLMNPYGTQTESPYPMLVAGCSRFSNRTPHEVSGGGTAGSVTSIMQAGTDATANTSAPIWYRKQSDGSYNTVVNWHTSAGAPVLDSSSGFYPVFLPVAPVSPGAGLPDVIVGLDNGGTENITTWMESNAAQAGGMIRPAGAPGIKFYPTITDNESLLVPVTLITSPSSAGVNTNDHTVRGEVDNVFWVSATKSDGSAMVAEDTITVAGNRYRLFQSGERNQPYDYFAIQEA